MSVREKLDYIESAFGVAAPNIGHNSEAFMEEQMEERMVWVAVNGTVPFYFEWGGYVFNTRKAAEKNAPQQPGPAEYPLSDVLNSARQSCKVDFVALLDINMNEVERWPTK